MNIFIMRAESPLDMEGSPDVAAVFADKDVAEETAELLNKEQEEAARAVWGDRWRAFATRYEIEPWEALTSVDDAVKRLKGLR